ncbi:hypothetical protein LARI1_G003669 [Lachnellula arida]|uniref:Uncharacterized protein n=1 Tax=Lachnellula arida TaxID=1316785 RepID=A0A8T9BFD9_9HELO|nr:hypothetical protein LARI1_G003669 [Lachnellula arida]
MLLTRPLPPQFLIPAWSARQLAGAHAVLHQQRACKSDDTSSQNKEDVRFNWNSNRGTTISWTTDTKNANPSPLSSSTSARETSPRSTGDSRDSTHSLHRPSTMRRASSDPRPAKPTAALSLFEELFPEEGEAKKRAEERREKLGRLPAFDWKKTIAGAENRNNVTRGVVERKRLQEEFGSLPSQARVALNGNGLRAENQQPGYFSEKEAEDGERGRRREASVLVLNSATKTLEESDFFRVGPRGGHIEGWTIIPGRENHTLRPLGHYFILFCNNVAAKAYLDNIYRLWRLAKQRSGWESSGIAGVPLPPGMLRDGEDIQKLVKSFTLVPPYSRLFLRMLSKPYKPGTLRLLDEGGPGAIAARKSKAENMVLITSDIGVIGHHELLRAIREDGKRRNMHWKLALCEDPLVQLKDDPVVDELEETGGSSESKRRTRTLRRPARYVLSFKDRHEARRFVREWHKRSMPEKREPKPGEELPPIVNAEILW